jgi:cell division protein FtsL
MAKHPIIIKKTGKPYTWLTLSLVVGLVFFNLASSLSVIYAKHLSRQYFSELQALQKKRDDLHVEWSQLLLEQGTWATDVRVERVAREHLHMVVPAPESVKVIR